MFCEASQTIGHSSTPQLVTGVSLAERVRSAWEHYGLPRYITNNEMDRGLERHSLPAETPEAFGLRPLHSVQGRPSRPKATTFQVVVSCNSILVSINRKTSVHRGRFGPVYRAPRFGAGRQSASLLQGRRLHIRPN